MKNKFLTITFSIIGIVLLVSCSPALPAPTLVAAAAEQCPTNGSKHTGTCC